MYVCMYVNTFLCNNLQINAGIKATFYITKTSIKINKIVILLWGFEFCVESRHQSSPQIHYWLEGFISVIVFFLFCSVCVSLPFSILPSLFPLLFFFLSPLLFFLSKDAVQWVNSTSDYCTCRSRQVQVL